MQLGVTTGEVEGDVIHPADSPFRQQAVVVGHRADERILRLVKVDGNVGVGHGSGFRRSGVCFGGGCWAGAIVCENGADATACLSD